MHDVRCMSAKMVHFFSEKQEWVLSGKIAKFLLLILPWDILIPLTGNKVMQLYIEKFIVRKRILCTTLTTKQGNETSGANTIPNVDTD